MKVKTIEIVITLEDVPEPDSSATALSARADSWAAEALFDKLTETHHAGDAWMTIENQHFMVTQQQISTPGRHLVETRFGLELKP